MDRRKRLILDLAQYRGLKRKRPWQWDRQLLGFCQYEPQYEHVCSHCHVDHRRADLHGDSIGDDTVDLLGTKEIERALEELILEKAEGVPFFIKEFIKSLQDIKAIVREDSRPRM